MSKYTNEFKLEALLKFSEVKRSTFYYQLSRLEVPDKYKEIKEQIKSIYNESKGIYGHKRIRTELTLLRS